MQLLVVVQSPNNITVTTITHAKMTRQGCLLLIKLFIEEAILIYIRHVICLLSLWHTASSAFAVLFPQSNAILLAQCQCLH